MVKFKMIRPTKLFVLWRNRERSNLFFIDLQDDINEKRIKAYSTRENIKVYNITVIMQQKSKAGGVYVTTQRCEGRGGGGRGAAAAAVWAPAAG